jgi:hypothetical protein
VTYAPHELLTEETCDPQLLCRHDEQAELPAPFVPVAPWQDGTPELPPLLELLHATSKATAARVAVVNQQDIFTSPPPRRESKPPPLIVSRSVSVADRQSKPPSERNASPNRAFLVAGRLAPDRAIRPRHRTICRLRLWGPRTPQGDDGPAGRRGAVVAVRGEGFDGVPIEYAGADVTIGFNARYLSTFSPPSTKTKSSSASAESLIRRS